jgi:hypothetical protein
MHRSIFFFASTFLVFAGVAAFAQQTPPPQKDTPQTAPKPSPAATEGTPNEVKKPRVFITDSPSWAAIGGFAVANGSGGGAVAAGSSPQTVEVINDFSKQCPSVIVTNDKANADYVVLFDRDAAAKSKTVLAVADKIAVFKKNGDLVYSGKTRSVVNAVKDACAALKK